MSAQAGVLGTEKKDLSPVFDRILSLFSSSDEQLDNYAKGLFRCGGCRRQLKLADFDSLSLHPCPKCKEMNFIPRGVNGFWLLEPLGGGGMGSVYRARHPDYSRELFAVKLLHGDSQANPSAIDSLAREIRVMKGIGFHPAIGSIVDSGGEGKDMFLATRFIEGERLDQRISRMGEIPELEVLLIGLRLLSAVAHVYDNGYLYRDLKPQNIILAKEGASLIDFGISLRVEDAMNPEVNDSQGSALYYPPERVSHVGERACSEIYSLGMVMYHAMTGSPYFTAKDIETMTTLNVRKARLKRQNKRAQQLKPDVTRILETMIRRNPGERYQTFIELEHDLMQAVLKRTWGSTK